MGFQGPSDEIVAGFRSYFSRKAWQVLKIIFWSHSFRRFRRRFPIPIDLESQKFSFSILASAVSTTGSKSCINQRGFLSQGKQVPWVIIVSNTATETQRIHVQGSHHARCDQKCLNNIKFSVFLAYYMSIKFVCKTSL